MRISHLHKLFYTTHPFANPYTKQPLNLDGTNIFIHKYPEILKGGRLDWKHYWQQKIDSCRYLDDLVSPFLEQLSCRTLIFADHGFYNASAYSPTKNFENVSKGDWSFGEHLIRIPLAILSPEMGVGESNDLISLMEFNNIVNALLNKRPFNYNKKNFIKIVRSEIYDPNFRLVGKSLGFEHELQAFEGFIFTSKHKLVIYADGSVYLYYTDNDREVPDKMLKTMLFACIINEITVCNPAKCFNYLANEIITSQSKGADAV